MVTKPTPGATGWNVAVDEVIDIANSVADLPSRVAALEAGGGDVTEAELAAGLATKAAAVHNHAEFITQDNGDNRYILQTNAGTFAPAEATTTELAGKQPLDGDLTALAGLDSATAGTVASDGAGWVKKTYAQLKTALGLVKGDVGLGNVDNTSDANKPVSTATQTALNAKATTSSLATIATSGKLANTTDLTVTGAAVGKVVAAATVTGGAADTFALRWPSPTQQPALSKLFAGLAGRERVPARIAFVGSSTTAGQEATHPQARWVNLFISDLQVAYPSVLPYESPVTVVDGSAASTRPGVQGFNGGGGGAAVANYMDATLRGRIGALNPCAVFHMIGANDYSTGTTPASFKTTLISQINALKGNITTPCVHVVIGTYARPDVTSPAYPWSAYLDAMAEVAAADPDNVAYLDVSTAYTGVGIESTDPFNLINSDNIHQDNAGHRLMVDAMRRSLSIPDSRGARWLAWDRFDRADATALGDAESGHTWTVEAGGVFAITSGQVSQSVSGNAVVDVRTWDYEVVAEITLVASSTVGLLMRSLDASNRLVVAVSVGSPITLYKVVAGTTTTPASGVTVINPGTYVFRVIAKGPDITVLVDGVKQFTYTLTGDELTNHCLTGSRVGVRAGSVQTGVRYDNWGCKILTA